MKNLTKRTPPGWNAHIRQCKRCAAGSLCFKGAEMLRRQPTIEDEEEKKEVEA